MTRLVIALVLFGAALSAQAPVMPASSPQAPSVPAAQPLSPPSGVPAAPTEPLERPTRLMIAQRLALIAYPELQQVATQIRVTDRAEGPLVTFGAADRDRADVLGLSRPRAALLVIDTGFDTQDALVSSVLRGQLARSADRRRIAALSDGWAQVLQAEGAQFGPTRQAAFAARLTSADVGRLMGTLSIQSMQFQRGSGEEPLFWEVSTTALNGDKATLAFEPYAGRLVRVTKGSAK